MSVSKENASKMIAICAAVPMANAVSMAFVNLTPVPISHAPSANSAGMANALTPVPMSHAPINKSVSMANALTTHHKPGLVTALLVRRAISASKANAKEIPAKM